MANSRRINELFEKQAKRNPFANSVLYRDQWITYQELDKRANQFSRYLQSIHHINSGGIIGLSVEGKSIHLLIAIMGILKAGAIYKPLSANYNAPNHGCSR